MSRDTHQVFSTHETPEKKILLYEKIEPVTVFLKALKCLNQEIVVMCFYFQSVVST